MLTPEELYEAWREPPSLAGDCAPGDPDRSPVVFHETEIFIVRWERVANFVNQALADVEAQRDEQFRRA